MAMLLDSVAPLVKMISLGSAPIRSATCCSEKNTQNQWQRSNFFFHYLPQHDPKLTYKPRAHNNLIISILNGRI